MNIYTIGVIVVFIAISLLSLALTSPNFINFSGKASAPVMYEVAPDEPLTISKLITCKDSSQNFDCPGGCTPHNQDDHSGGGYEGGYCWCSSSRSKYTCFDHPTYLNR
jgi:hypothetical protein